jgi:phage gp36-like protein
MSFLIDSDFDVQSRTELMRVLEVSTLSRPMAENMAEAEISSYLRPRGCDIPAIFSASGDDRHPLIIMRMIDIVIYHLCSNINGRAVPDTRQKRYDAAIDWLDKVNRGLLDPDLPMIVDETKDPTPTIRLGTNQKYSSRW